jgi:hypothetical protein
MRELRGVAAAMVLAAALSAAPRPAWAIQMDTAVLQALDKIAARVSPIEVPVGQMVKFGSLEITVRECDKRPPEETPESTAFLEIVERKPNESPVFIFKGWMFASSPALSALEHPVYDVWVVDCKNRSNAPAGSSP